MNFMLTSGAGATSSGGGIFTMILPLVLMFGLLYLFMIRPENKRKKEAEAMRNAVKTGDRITTIGGIVGTVVNVKDDRIVIETSADRVRMELAKWSISTNDSAEAAAKEKAKKEAEARAKAKAEKKAAKGK